MPRGGPLHQILSTCRVSELQRLRRTHCPRVSEYSGDKQAFVRRLRNSLKRSIDDGHLSYADIMNTLRDELEQTDRRRATTRIRDAVDNLTVTPNAGDADTTSVREKWISSELFHALAYEFSDQPYQIHQEYSLGRSSVDLVVEHESQTRRYIIEIKRAGHHSSREKALMQIRRYRKRTNGCSRAFLVMVVENERDLPENKRSVKSVIDEVNDEADTEVLLKPPSDLLY